MKSTVAIIVLLAVVGVTLWYAVINPRATQYVNKVETKEVTKEVDALELKIQSAIASSSSEIEVRAKNAYTTAKRAAEVDIELEVREAYKKELEKKEKELQKESVAYWREIANVKQLIRDTFPDDLRMVEVARLESGFVHYKENGQVLKGHVTPADTGLMQVNCTHWCDEAKALNLDINNIVDNVKMARHIYDVQGITAWVAFNNHMAKR